jgi:circadian clock protein KaiC
MTVDDTVQRILNSPNRVSINQFPAGVPGLDEVLGGGIPEYSFNLIAGAPGTAK